MSNPKNQQLPDSISQAEIPQFAQQVIIATWQWNSQEHPPTVVLLNDLSTIQEPQWGGLVSCIVLYDLRFSSEVVLHLLACVSIQEPAGTRSRRAVFLTNPPR